MYVIVLRLPNAAQLLSVRESLNMEKSTLSIDVACTIDVDKRRDFEG